MALEKFLMRMFSEIDEDSSRQKKIVRYVCQLINSNHNEFFDVFCDVIEKDFQNYLKRNSGEADSNFKNYIFEERLYFETLNMLNELEKDAIEIVGVNSYLEEINDPSVKLGLTEYSRKSILNKTSKRTLTQKGKSLVDEYRKVKGLLPIDITKEMNEHILKREIYALNKI